MRAHPETVRPQVAEPRGAHAFPGRRCAHARAREPERGSWESGRAFRLTSCLPERCRGAAGGRGGRPDPRAAPAPVRGAVSCPLTRATSSCVDGGSRLSGPQRVLLLLGLRSRPLRTRCSPRPGHLPAVVLPGTGLPASPLCRPLPRWARRSRKSNVCDCLKNAHARDLLVPGAGELAQLRGRLPGAVGARGRPTPGRES